MKTNTIQLGDNLEVMRGMDSGCIDLIATDPPFNTGKDWDTWQFNDQVGGRHERLSEVHGATPSGDAPLTQGYGQHLYLHCDTNASHYLKVMMDTIFGMKHFRNEIVWKRRYGRSNGTRKSSIPQKTIAFYFIQRQINMCLT